MLLKSVLTLVPLTAVTFVVRRQNTQTLDVTIKGCDKLAEGDLMHVSQIFYNLCETSNTLLNLQLQSGMGAAQRLLEHGGGAHFSTVETVSWQALSQDTNAVVAADLPRGIPGNFGAGETLEKFVTDVRVATGANCTIFQKLNAQASALQAVSSSLEEMFLGRTSR